MHFSRETGSGLPHLHFELIDGETRIDPVRYGALPIKDTLPPRLKSLSFIPLSGSGEEIELPLEYGSSSGISRNVIPGQPEKGKESVVLDHSVSVPFCGTYLVELEGYDPSGRNARLSFSRVTLECDRKICFQQSIQPEAHSELFRFRKKLPRKQSGHDPETGGSQIWTSAASPPGSGGEPLWSTFPDPFARKDPIKFEPESGTGRAMIRALYFRATFYYEKQTVP